MAFPQAWHCVGLSWEHRLTPIQLKIRSMATLNKPLALPFGPDAMTGNSLFEEESNEVR